MNGFSKWLRKTYNKITGSIAFYPAIIAIAFLALSWFMLELDFSETGKHIKAVVGWIRLRDATTARSIVSTIVAGIISLTVFSFSMVMILLNQAASQMTNRMLDSMIGNRFQQIVLGFYIGTIVYALFLLSSIRNIDSGIYVPALSIYLLLFLTVADIFLFIYFLHYVTQSVKFETVIKRVYKQTLKTLNDTCTTEQPEIFTAPETGSQTIYMQASNYFQGFNKSEVIKFACRHNGVIQFLHPPGTYILKNLPLLLFYSAEQLSKDDINKLYTSIDFYNGQPVEYNAYYGYHQLAEVAIKALSPGINDPETAVLSLNALSDLFFYRLDHYIRTVFKDSDNVVRVKTIDWNFEQLFAECFNPVWKYGKDDLYIQNAIMQILEQLKQADKNENHIAMFNIFLNKVKKKIESKADND